MMPSLLLLGDVFEFTAQIAPVFAALSVPWEASLRATQSACLSATQGGKFLGSSNEVEIFLMARV